MNKRYLNEHIKRVEYLARLLDNQFGIGPIRFGVDPILGLVPGFGDIFPALVSLYIVWIGYRLNIPRGELGNMFLNIVLDFIVGTIPLIGDLGDFAFKSNTRNLTILKRYLKQDIIEGEIVS